MSGFQFTVYMDRRDVTGWVRRCKVGIADSAHRFFELRLSAWHSFDSTNKWDIYASYDAGNPRADHVIMQGIVPHDRQRVIHVGKDLVPNLIVQGFDYVWLTKRKAPTETIIMVPGTTNVEQDVKLALRNFRGPVGAYRTWTGVRTLHDAITRLGRAAGIRTSCRFPNYDMAAYVIDPAKSYWKAMEDLTNPYAIVRYFNRHTNTLVMQDASQVIMGAGNKLLPGADTINKMDVQPVGWAIPRRILLRIPAWR